MKKHVDIGSVIIILTTFVLFPLALFIKAVAQDMLLEAGVLLVSIKLIIMAYKTRTANTEIKKELQEIKQMIAQDRVPEDGTTEPQRTEDR